MGWSNAGSVEVMPDPQDEGPWQQIVLWGRGEQDSSVKLEIPGGKFLHLDSRRARRLAFLILAETE